MADNASNNVDIQKDLNDSIDKQLDTKKMEEEMEKNFKESSMSEDCDLSIDDVDPLTESMLRNDKYFMTNLAEMQMCQEGLDRVGYINKAIEAASSPSTQSIVLNKLYKSMQKVGMVDFGPIPNSKGDITKYVYYDQLYDMIELINKLIETPTANVELLNKFHKFLLDAAPDFAFGFRTNNELLMTMYNVFVITLYSLIDICIIDCTSHLRVKFDPTAKVSSALDNTKIVKSAQQIIIYYENGTWSTMMKKIKTGAVEINPDTSLDSYLANPDNGTSVLEAISFTGFKDGAMKVLGNVNTGLNKISHNKGIKVLSVGIILVGLFFAVRYLVYAFMNKAANLKDSIKTNAKILQTSMAIENDPSKSAMEKQKAMLNRLEGISDVIEYRILKSEKSAAKQIETENKVEFSPKAITSISGSDFEI